MSGAVAVLDAAYGEALAVGAAVLIADFEAPQALETLTASLPRPAEDYAPGAFYRRELPVLMAVLAQVRRPLAAIVIDGYVHLDAAGRPGLGARLFDALGGGVPVIGVAKTPFGGDDWSAAVRRGTSGRALHVTAAGMSMETAVSAVLSMAGAHRLPAMCKLADRLARDALQKAA